MLGRFWHGIRSMATYSTRPDPEQSAGRWSWYNPAASLPTKVDEYSAFTYSPVYAAIDLISSDVAMLPWRVHERAGDKRLLRDDHAVDRLLNVQPNPEMGAFHFRKVLQQHVLSWGNGYAEIERNFRGEPIALWPMLPNQVTPKRTPDGVLVYLWKDDNGTERQLTTDRVLHIHGMGFDGIVGYSPIRMAMLSIARGKAAEEFGAGFFAGGGRPSGVLKHPGKVGQETAEKMRDDWQKLHGGARNAGRVAILQQGFEYSPVGIPPEEAQFLQTMEFSVVDVARWFRVPPHKIGHLNLTTVGNSEEQERQYAVTTLDQWVTIWQQEADGKLLGDQSQGENRLYTRMNLKARLRADAKSRASYYREMNGIGVLTVNEIRREEDMDPIGPEGDTRYVPLNMGKLGEDVSRSPERSTAAPVPARASMESMRSVVDAAVDTIATKGEKATERARKKAGVDEWASDFFGQMYAEAQRVVWPGVAAMCGLAGVPEDDAGVAIAVRQWAASACERMCDRAKGADESAIDRRGLADSLIELVDGALAVAAMKGA